MEKNISLKKMSHGEGPEYVLFNKDKGEYKIWATSEKFPELIDTLLSQVPEKYRVKLAEKILNK